MNAPSCGTCGRPMPPMQAGAPPQGQPAKTMFGYAAPQVPRPGSAPAQPPAPAPAAGRPAPAPQGGFQPPQPQGFQPPQPQGFQPPQPQGFQPPAPQAPPPAFGAPPPQQGFQPPPQQGFAPPPQQGFQPPPQQGGFQPPPQQGGFQPPPQQQGFGAQGGYPQAPNPYAQPDPSHGHHGGLDNLAGRLPSSAPGTLFGFPISMLRDPSVQKKILFIAGVALIASIIVPFTLSPTRFAWDAPDKFVPLIWPIIAGGLYLLVAAAPPNLRQQVPPVVLQWIPFGVSFASLFMLGSGGGHGVNPYDTLYMLGYATVVFGLLARIAQPQDQIARIVIAVGSGLLFVRWIDMFGVFHFSGVPALEIIHNLLWFVVTTLGVLCVLFVVPPQKLPPALQAIDAFGPLICALMIVWLPLQVILLGLDMLVGHMGASAILIMAHMLLPIVAYFGVLMMSAPAAYEEAKAMATGQRPPGPPPGGPGGYGPPPGGGYGPPPGGGYPPPQGGGGYPPQGGGGYPPPQGGGGYPPQGGGGWQ